MIRERNLRIFSFDFHDESKLSDLVSLHEKSICLKSNMSFRDYYNELRQLLLCVGGFTIEIDGLGFEIVGRRVRI